MSQGQGKGPLCCRTAALSLGQGNVRLAVLFGALVGLMMRDELQTIVFHLLDFTP